MGTRKFKPTSPSRRAMSTSDFSDVTKSTPEKSLLSKKSGKGGRNNRGRITVRRRGGGHKRRYRVVDFRRDKIDVPGKVAGIEYDPNRSARTALIHYLDGEKRYILAPHGLKVGAMVVSAEKADIQPGTPCPCIRYPWVRGSTILSSNWQGGQICRSAGSYAQVMARKAPMLLLRLPSGSCAKYTGGVWPRLPGKIWSMRTKRW